MLGADGENAEHYDVRYDWSIGVLIIEMRGYWTDAVAASFSRELRKVIGSIRRAGTDRHVTLVDMRQYNTQSQNVVEILNECATDPSIAPRKMAMVTPSALTRIQNRRMAPGHRDFTDVEEALTWLRAD